MRPPAADARRGGGFATGENSWGHRARSAGTRGVRFGASPHRCGRKALPPCGEAAVKGRWAGVPIDPLAYGSSTCGFALRNLHKSPGLRVGDLAASAVDFRVAGTLRPAAIGAGFARLVAGWVRSRSAGVRGLGADASGSRSARTKKCVFCSKMRFGNGCAALGDGAAPAARP